MNKQSIRNMVSFIVIICNILIFIFTLSACREADKVNHNLSKEADYFNCERRITVYNARTDTIVLQAEGYMSLSNNSTNEIVATFKTGESEYKKNYIYLNQYTLYVVEDITGTHTDPYHYEIQFHVLPQYEVELLP